MNYLAHLYLSGNNDQIMVGNFIGDYVKGNSWNKYPEKIKLGIQIHRQIDAFTDAHQKFREAKVVFKPEFGLYSGIVIDFIYDHFLASEWKEYSDIGLRKFANHVHSVLIRNFFYLPSPVQGFLPFLIKNRRLETYATIDGIIESVSIMSKYTSLPAKPAILRETLIESYPFFRENFTDFMNDLINFVNNSYDFEIVRKVNSPK